jgi:hypothetical protein
MFLFTHSTESVYIQTFLGTLSTNSLYGHCLVGNPNFIKACNQHRSLCQESLNRALAMSCADCFIKKSMNGKVECAELLITLGANGINKKIVSLLVEYGRFDLLKILDNQIPNFIQSFVHLGTDRYHNDTYRFINEKYELTDHVQVKLLNNNCGNLIPETIANVKKYNKERRAYLKKALDNILFAVTYYDMNILGIVNTYIRYEEPPTLLESLKLKFLF